MSPQNSATAAGQTDTPAVVDAINQVFALFRINFHNQFYAAFNDVQLLKQAKRLWLESLRQYPVECLLKAARQIIEQSEYLPTLHKMIEACDQQSDETGLPTVRDAYLEACLASHPKAQYPWSHPAVYHAGARTGWYDLENQAEYVSWPNFKRNYEEYKRKALQGESLQIESTIDLPEPEKSTLSKTERQQQLQTLRKKLNL
ncbi:MAG: hypothetical protein DRR06_01295 [Gammaproteobacteria bacterium]|nr:MAG: hypothetical protein DRR06_01295 [Gammaproteobacteria bacterium]RLA54289.1 MAG: hypothetical protein DRR42_02230 [Gammaproteobacteria bacterium]